MTETTVDLGYLEYDAPAEDIAAATAAHRHAAEDAAERAERDQAQYDEQMEAARQRAAQVIADEEARSRPLADSAAEARRAVAVLRETTERLARTAQYAADAEVKEAALRALEDERAGLDENQAGLGKRLAELAARRRELQPRLDSALDGDDERLIADLRTELDTIGSREERLRAQQAPLIARLQEIGDGEFYPATVVQKELYRAREDARHARNSARTALHYAQPDSPAGRAYAQRERELKLDRYLAGWASAAGSRSQPGR